MNSVKRISATNFGNGSYNKTFYKMRKSNLSVNDFIAPIKSENINAIEKRRNIKNIFRPIHNMIEKIKYNLSGQKAIDDATRLNKEFSQKTCDEYQNIKNMSEEMCEF